MSTDTGGPGGKDSNGTTKIDVRVPTELLEEIDEEYQRRGYTSRSEAIRDALRDWVEPTVQLSKETLEDLAASREQREHGETHSANDVRTRLGLDGEE
ncbi:ribbon-helix-helix protein, CopG family [Natronococcus sp. JC468]|uniref:ribbon-helix-helix domain-containing protein n=1 Tax=Natronococcus sp. JC468 TaxID=1961921 RepID=UPI00143AC6B0|nr:ribbon-helix-helix domain-containing protein [Natronococcus sp. JC468]NKE37541.1 ribbon-helix-helix protein, CopG family [Natronococcus sp. JC468]